MIHQSYTVCVQVLFSDLYDGKNAPASCAAIRTVTRRCDPILITREPRLAILLGRIRIVDIENCAEECRGREITQRLRRPIEREERR